MSTTIYVIGSDGKILSRSVWNTADGMQAIVGAIARGEPVQSHELKTIARFSSRAVGPLFIGRVGAIRHFARGLHRLVGNRKDVGNM